MRKYKKGRKLSRKTGQRKALLKILAANLFLKEKIKTTKAKAKEISGYSEKMITRAKRGDLASKRLLIQSLDKKAVNKLFTDIAPRYKEKNGGYTRIIKLGPRKSDGAEMAIIELVK